MTAPKTGSYETVDLGESIVQSQKYNNVSYFSLPLYGCKTSETITPGCLKVPTSISTYWPEGFTHPDGSKIDTRLFDQETSRPYDSDPAHIRGIILGLELSRRAMKRWTDLNTDTIKSARQLIMTAQDVSIEKYCKNRGVPLGALVLSKVVRPNGKDSDQTVADLYFPLALSDPGMALKEIKDAHRIEAAKPQLHIVQS